MSASAWPPSGVAIIGTESSNATVHDDGYHLWEPVYDEAGVATDHQMCSRVHDGEPCLAVR